jgi:hypothetical protein
MQHEPLRHHQCLWSPHSALSNLRTDSSLAREFSKLPRSLQSALHVQSFVFTCGYSPCRQPWSDAQHATRCVDGRYKLSRLRLIEDCKIRQHTTLVNNGITAGRIEVGNQMQAHLIFPVPYLFEEMRHVDLF